MDLNAKNCLDACNLCAIECGVCFSHMVGKESINACPSCCIECAAVCRLCADAIARNSPFTKELCQLCADLCDWCAKECGAHDMEHCRRCAAACLACAAACRKLSA